MPSSSLCSAHGYDRWMSKRGPLGAAMRFAMSVPGQILVNTAAFTLPEELRMRPNWRVLDVGCGRASLARVLAERARLQRPPVGLDASQRMLALARRDIEIGGGPSVCLTRGVANALPFTGESFDLVLSGHAFKYLTDDELSSYVAEARRVLKPGGLFLAWEFAPTKSRLLDRWNRWVLTREVPLVRLRSYRELRALARACGFDWVRDARLRPFLLPPVPRVSLVMGKAPEGWQRQIAHGRPILQHAPGEG